MGVRNGALLNDDVTNRDGYGYILVPIYIGEYCILNGFYALLISILPQEFLQFIKQWSKVTFFRGLKMERVRMSINTRLIAVSLLFLMTHAGATPKGIELQAAYYGEFITHPGLLLGAAYPFHQAGRHTFSGALQLGAYRHADNYRALFTGLETGYRYAFDAGPYLESTLGVAFQRSFTDGPLYRRVDGEVQRVDDWGRGVLIPSLSLGFGWDLARNQLPPVKLYTRFQLFGRYPVNGMLIPDFAMIMGVVYQTDWQVFP